MFLLGTSILTSDYVNTSFCMSDVCHKFWVHDLYLLIATKSNNRSCPVLLCWLNPWWFCQVSVKHALKWYHQARWFTCFVRSMVWSCNCWEQLNLRKCILPLQEFLTGVFTVIFSCWVTFRPIVSWRIVKGKEMMRLQRPFFWDRTTKVVDLILIMIFYPHKAIYGIFVTFASVVGAA